MKKLLTALIILVLTATTAFADGYIVRFKDGYTHPVSSVALLSAEPAVKEISAELNMYSISDDIKESLDMSDVEYIEPIYDIMLLDVPNDFDSSVQWNLPQINAPYAWSRGFTGSGVRIGIIDSGIDLTHPDLKNRVVAAVDYTGSGTVAEAANHGSMVAGIAAAEMNNGEGIAGVSAADIVALKVYHTGGSSDDMVTALIDAVNKYNCSVINMSIALVDANKNPVDGTELQSFIDAIELANRKGVLVVAASGNTGREALCYPASYDGVVSVASVDKQKRHSSFSTYASTVDISAPGSLVRTTVNGGKYTSTSGTSFAAPHVTGAAAILKGIKPDITQSEFEMLVEYTSDELGDMGHDSYYGFGLLNIYEMVAVAKGERLGAATPIFDSGRLTVSYAGFAPVSGSERAIAAVYDADGVLVYVSAETELSKVSDTEFSAVFSGIEIPSGGSAKVFCLKDRKTLAPAAKVAVYQN